jgi:hypothetical protein
MIILSGSDTAVSFTDETSIDSRKTNSQKVSVHAEIIREKPFDWFLKVISFFPDIKGELKSITVVNWYYSLEETKRAYINSSLKFARIHIVDPRPYLADIKKSVSSILPNKNIDLFLTDLVTKHERVAEELSDKLKRFVAEKMYFDAPHKRLNLCIEVSQQYSGFGYSRFLTENRKYDLDKLDYETFVDKKGRLRLDNVTLFISKSGSVFMDAIDEVKSPAFAAFSSFSKLKLARTLSKG